MKIKSYNSAKSCDMKIHILNGVFDFEGKVTFPSKMLAHDRKGENILEGINICA